MIMISHLLAVILVALSSGRVASFTSPSPPLQTHVRSKSISDDSPARLRMANDINLPRDDDAGKVRYLGSGEDAIIRPGVVLVAPNHEYDHFLKNSAVFVYAIGSDDETTVVRGVVLDHPTAFTIGEMSPNVMGVISNNQLYRGGYDGSDTAMLLHSAGGDGPVKSDKMIGSSGIYEGGIVSAMESVDSGLIDSSRCKFFFNYMQFTEKELDDMFAGTEDGDQWVSLEIPPEYVLDSDYDRGELWSKLRNNIREFRKQQ